MKCLIIDKVYAGIAEELSKYMEVKTAENLPSTKDQLLAEIGDVDVLIMRVDPKIDQEIIDAAKNLKVIGVCSVGLNHIDMDYAKSKGIQIFNAPGLNTALTSSRLVSSRLRSEGKDPPSLTRARVSNTLTRSSAARKARPASRRNKEVCHYDQQTRYPLSAA